MATSSFFVTIPNINSNYDSAYISKEPISASHSSGSSTPLYAHVFLVIICRRGSQQPTQLLYIPPTRYLMLFCSDFFLVYSDCLLPHFPPLVLKKNAELIFFSQYKNRLSFYTMLAIWTLLCAVFFFSIILIFRFSSLPVTITFPLL